MSFHPKHVSEGQNTILVPIRNSCLERSPKPVPEEGRASLALGDKRTCGPLGRRGKNLSTMHSTLNETGAKLSVHDIQTLLFICTKSWAHGSRKLQCSEHDSPAHHLADTLEAVGEGSFSVRWALEAADSGTRLPMEWGGP